MKKHPFLVPLFAFPICLATANAQAQSGTPGIIPANTVQTVREIAQQTFGVNDPGNGWKESHHDGCKKNRKGKKGRGHRGKHDCCCHRDCQGGNDYSRGDRRGYGGNDRNDRDYRYSTPPNEGNGSGQRNGVHTRAGQHTSSARVKTRPAQRSIPASTRPGAQKRPVHTRN